MTTRILSFLALILLGLGSWGCGRTAAFQAFTQGNVNYLTGEFDPAIADYTKAIELDPKDAEAHYSRSLVFKQKGLNSQAILDFETYLQLNPNAANRAQVEQFISEIK